MIGRVTPLGVPMTPDPENPHNPSACQELAPPAPDAPARGTVELIPAALHVRIGLLALARDVAAAIIISAIIIIFLYQPVRVEGTSMLPVLEDHDRLIINKLAFRVGEIHRGDVVVFRYPRDVTTSYIKRVIGLPGDTVRIDHGQVIVNGQPLREPYVPLRFTDDRSEPLITIPPHQYFVMGDHRLISSDSRTFGPVERELIYGKAAFVYWPVDQAGVVR